MLQQARIPRQMLSKQRQVPALNYCRSAKSRSPPPSAPDWSFRLNHPGVEQDTPPSLPVYRLYTTAMPTEVAYQLI
ncbi:MAG: hypothetical protein R3F53_25325 [Gammaproteobacteria bacterium]